MKYLSTLLFTVILLYGFSLHAEDPKISEAVKSDKSAIPKKVLLLNECINIAIENNTTIKASEEDKNKALADYRVATAQRLLFVDFSMKTDTYPKTTTTTRHKDLYKILPYVGSANQAFATYWLKKDEPKPSPFVDTLTRDYDLGITTSVTAQISLYNEKKAQNQAVAKVNLNMYKAQNKKTIIDVIYNVKRTYYTFRMSKEFVILREKIVKSNQDRLKITEILYKNAQRSILELSKAKYDFQDAQLELLKAKNNERIARIDLYKTMGVEDQGPNFVPEANDEFPDIAYSLEQLNNFGELNNPDLKVLKIQTQLNKVRIDFEKAGHYPEVDFQFGGGYRNNRIDFVTSANNFKSDSWKPVLAVNFIARMPIFSSGAVTNRVESVKADYNKSLYREKDAILATRTMIESQYSTIQELKKQVEMTRLMKENASKHMLLAKKTYESGASTQLELNDAMMSFTNAELSYQKVKFDYAMALAKLSSIVDLGEDSLCKK